jgi:hypothetical protein
VSGFLARRRVRARAGASVVRQYEERKRAWRRRNRKVFLVAELIVGVIIAATLFAAWPHVWTWVGGFVAGGALALYLALRESPPPWIQNYQVGALGEERTAKALEPLLKRGWVVVHDLNRIKSNLDHVLVGPAGVFVLDSKNLHGTVQIDGDVLSLTRPGDDRIAYSSDSLAQSARRQGYELNRLVKRRCDRSPWVSAVVVVWAEFPQRAAAGRSMHFVHGDYLIEWLDAQPARLSAVQVNEIAASLQPGQRHRAKLPTDTASSPAL